MKKSNEEKPPTAIDSVAEDNESPSNCAPKVSGIFIIESLNVGLCEIHLSSCSEAR